MQLQHVEIFTDGGCWDNPGPGGWGAILSCNGSEKVLSGSEPYTTNNRMEMTAAIEGLSALKAACRVTIYTDSKYLKDGIEWMVGWKKNGWKTKEKKWVKNIDLWKELDTLLQKHDVDWKWVKGHAGNEKNERADTLATRAIEDFMSKLVQQQPTLF